MTPKEAAEVAAIIERLIDAVKNGTTHIDPYGLELTRRALDTIAEARKYQQAIRTVAALKVGA